VNRIVVLFSVLIAFALLAGCGDQASETATPESASPESAESAAAAPEASTPEAEAGLDPADVTPQADLEKTEAEVRAQAESLDKEGLDSVISRYKAYISELQADIKNLSTQGLTGGEGIMTKVTQIKKDLEVVMAHLGIYEEAKAAK
jgi:hypothetical protein